MLREQAAWKYREHVALKKRRKCQWVNTLAKETVSAIREVWVKEGAMQIVCLDLEGVLVPEIWIAFSEATGIPELKRTTRDEPDYDKLMKFRIDVLKEQRSTLFLVPKSF